MLGDGGSDAGGLDDASRRDASQELGDAQEGSSGVDGGAPETGVVAIEASVELEKVGASTQCPGISVFSIAPAGLSPGQLAHLTVATVGPPAAVHWSVSPPSGGAFSNATALMPTFQCAVAGTVLVTVTAGLADSGSCEGVRFTSYSGEIDCQR